MFLHKLTLWLRVVWHIALYKCQISKKLVLAQSLNRKNHGLATCVSPIFITIQFKFPQFLVKFDPRPSCTRSSKKSGKHRSSFSRYSEAAKVVAAILFLGKFYLVTLLRY
uniref:Uncharacterized protein n=1 Tax=Amphimedon queenslandica TaxID=400682 RepID=A0A1X7UI95_AMPQE